MSDLFAPWITDPDAPEEPMTSAAASAAAKALAQAYPDLVDKSQDGPISVEDIAAEADINKWIEEHWSK